MSIAVNVQNRDSRSTFSDVCLDSLPEARISASRVHQIRMALELDLKFLCELHKVMCLGQSLDRGLAQARNDGAERFIIVVSAKMMSDHDEAFVDTSSLLWLRINENNGGHPSRYVIEKIDGFADGTAFLFAKIVAENIARLQLAQLPISSSL